MTLFETWLMQFDREALEQISHHCAVTGALIDDQTPEQEKLRMDLHFAVLAILDGQSIVGWHDRTQARK